MHQFARVAIPSLTRTEKEVGRLVAKIKQLAAREPEKASGSGHLLAEVMAVLKAQPGEEASTEITQTFAAQACRQSATMWATLSAREQGQLYAKAQCAMLAKKEQIAEEVAALNKKYEALMKEVAEESRQIPPLRMSACKLTDKYLDLFESLCTSQTFKKPDRIKELRDAALTCPRPVTQARLGVLKEFE
eukprot:11207081-Lingulodinium_polyedra.AAC.1